MTNTAKYVMKIYTQLYKVSVPYKYLIKKYHLVYTSADSARKKTYFTIHVSIRLKVSRVIFSLTARSNRRNSTEDILLIVLARSNKKLPRKQKVVAHRRYFALSLSVYI